MVSRIDSPRAVVPAPALAKPVAAPAAPAAPQMAGDALTLSKPAADPAIGQTRRIENGKIYASTTVKIDADPEFVLAALQDDWSKWWPNAQVGPLPKGAGLPAPGPNERQFEFSPLASAGVAPMRYNVRQLEAKAESAGPNGQLMMVIPAKLSGAMKGEARFELRQTADGKTLLTSRWDGVAPAGLAGKGPGPDLAARAHLKLEANAFQALEAMVKAQQAAEQQ
jgi:hypothetical protein